MRIKNKALLAVLAVLFLTTLERAHAIPQPDELTRHNWLVAGPFPSIGDNALFKNYLNAPTGELRVRARETDVAGVTENGPVKWQAAASSSDGEIDFAKLWPGRKRSIAYAFTEIDSVRERRVVATIGSGSNVQVQLNGEILYESRLSRKPGPDVDTLVLNLKKGLNTILVKVEGAEGDWKLRWKTHSPNGRLFVNQNATIIPDFRVGEIVGAWGQLEVANTGARELSE